MRTADVGPTGVERRFGANEVIVSKTDLKGRIKYVNDVFVRVSGYSEADLVGRPHNVIRHPAMPRSVFALLWSELLAGREVFAYIVNLAADGAHYWVLAHVTPSYVDGQVIGYHSNRRLPSPRAVSTVERIYADLLAIEHRHRHPRAAIDASTAALTDLLAERGITFEELVLSLATEDLP